MPQPPSYNRQYDFTDFSAAYPSDQQPGVQMDAEFNALKATVDAILANLILIQRDDGALKNASVALEQLATDVIALIGAGNWTIKGSWLTATAYAVGDVVAESGNTYVCAVAHTAGTFATDLAAAKWATIYGATSVSVPDGAVTTIKLADGAVTSAKLDSAITLTGNFKASTLTAGTATAGSYLVGAKTASGSARMYVARTTRTQGAVGLQIDGGTSGSVWSVESASSSDDLSISNSLGAVTTATMRTTGDVDWNYTQRVTGAAAPASGAGLETYYSSSIGYVDSRDRSASTWKDLKIRGLTVFLAGGGVDIIKVTSTGATVSDTVADYAIGYRDIPQLAKTSAYTIGSTDGNKHISITTGGVVIPANASVPLPIGFTSGIYNNSGSSQTISITSDTLRQLGTANTGSRTLAARGWATIIKLNTTEWGIMGAGLS